MTEGGLAGRKPVPRNDIEKRLAQTSFGCLELGGFCFLSAPVPRESDTTWLTAVNTNVQRRSDSKREQGICPEILEKVQDKPQQGPKLNDPSSVFVYAKLAVAPKSFLNGPGYYSRQSAQEFPSRRSACLLRECRGWFATGTAPNTWASSPESPRGTLHDAVNEKYGISFMGW